MNELLKPGAVVSARYRIDAIEPSTREATGVDLSSGEPVLLALIEHAEAEPLQPAVGLSGPDLLELLGLEKVGGGVLAVCRVGAGASLADAVSEQGLLDPVTAIQALLPIFTTASHLHRSSAVHGSIVPDTIRLDPRPRLAFRPGRPGPSAFRSPERNDGGGCSARDDAWALSACLYYALVGEPPARSGIGAPDELFLAGISDQRLRAVLFQGLATARVQRAASAEPLRAALREWWAAVSEQSLAGSPSGATPGSLPPPPSAAPAARWEPGAGATLESPVYHTPAMPVVAPRFTRPQMMSSPGVALDLEASPPRAPEPPGAPRPAPPRTTSHRSVASPQPSPRHAGLAPPPPSSRTLSSPLAPPPPRRSAPPSVRPAPPAARAPSVRPAAPAARAPSVRPAPPSPRRGALPPPSVRPAPPSPRRGALPPPSVRPAPGASASASDHSARNHPTLASALTLDPAAQAPHAVAPHALRAGAWGADEVADTVRADASASLAPPGGDVAQLEETEDPTTLFTPPPGLGRTLLMEPQLEAAAPAAEAPAPAAGSLVASGCAVAPPGAGSSYHAATVEVPIGGEYATLGSAVAPPEADSDFLAATSHGVGRTVIFVGAAVVTLSVLGVGAWLVVSALGSHADERVASTPSAESTTRTVSAAKLPPAPRSAAPAVAAAPTVTAAAPTPGAKSGSAAPPEAATAAPTPGAKLGSAAPPEAATAAPTPAAKSGSAAPPEAATAAPTPAAKLGTASDGDVGACVERLLPQGTFRQTPQLDWMCAQADARRGALDLKKAVVRGAGGGLTPAMKSYSRLGWYELTSYATLQSACCSAPAPTSLPAPAPHCAPLAPLVTSLARAARTGAALDADLTAFVSAANCEAAAGRAGAYWMKRAPTGHERSAFEAWVAALRR